MATKHYFLVVAVLAMAAAGVTGWLAHTTGPSSVMVSAGKAYVSKNAHVVTTVPTYAQAVGHIQIDNPNAEEERRHGHCTGTLTGPATVLSAVHCFTDVDPTTSTLTFTPAMHTDASGTVIRPFGTCKLAPVRTRYESVTADKVRIDVTSCSDPAGVQQPALAAIGNRTGVLPTATMPVARWYSPAMETKRVVLLGYPKVDTEGNDTGGQKLFTLSVSPTGNRYTIENRIGPGVLVVNDMLNVGASGGPMLMKVKNEWTVVGVISRLETWETTWRPNAMSGPTL